MIKEVTRLFFTLMFLMICISAFSQQNTLETRTVNTTIDTLKSIDTIFFRNRKAPEISLSTKQAIHFLQQKFKTKNWNDQDDPFRKALGQLIFEASHPLFDSAEFLLKSYPYDSLNIPWDKFYIWEPLRLKIPVENAAQYVNQADSLIQAVNELKDTTVLIVTDTLKEVSSSNSMFPFRYANFPYQGDSIKIAVKSLLKYLEDRDSTIIYFTGIGNMVTPVWANTRINRMTRFWLKNEFSDSVTVWIGNPSADTIELYLEQGVNFRRPVRQGNYSNARIDLEHLDNSKLQEVKKIIVKPQYWRYHEEASFLLSQASLTNWVRGGESSISTSMDITGYANYNNKLLKLSSANFARFKLGFLASGNNPIRKNIDLLETNSKLNHLAFGKFDFSGILLLKTQIAPGYNYPNDSVQVSKFINPLTVTVGLGLDYKPNSTTSINFSPLSYKGTFVPDTSDIDQTQYGIPKNRTSLNEPGVSFMISNEFRPFKNIVITNRLQLFTNYIHKPQNIDIDWEMIFVANLNWFTDVRFNTHLIFDDDTRTQVLDKEKKPVLRADGTQKKTARPQFKEILGFSFVFRF